jgi:hypothetical protein
VVLLGTFFFVEWVRGRLSLLKRVPGNSWGKDGRCVRLTTYHPQVPMSRNLEALTSQHPLGLIGLEGECFAFLLDKSNTFTNMTYHTTSVDAITLISTELYSYLNGCLTNFRVRIMKAWNWKGSLSERHSSHFLSYSWGRNQSSRIRGEAGYCTA